MKKFISLFIFLACYSAYSQSLSVFDVDVSDFPKIKAKVFVFDKEGNQIQDLSKYNLLLTEDSVAKVDLKIKCYPPKPIQPLSTILTIDIASNMCETLEIAKAAASTWIKLLPLSKSECAITAFRSNNYIISDFTQDCAELLKNIDNLKCDSIGEFDPEYLNRCAGILRLADNGKFTRVLVLYTNGFVDINKDEIIKNAKASNIIIYCVTVDHPTPEILKEIATKTGGQYFDEVTTSAQAENIYRGILMMAQGIDPCEIEWIGNECTIKRKASLKVLQPSEDLKHSEGMATHFSITIPYEKLPQIKYSPSLSVKFKIKEPGKVYNEKISITAQNEPLNIEGIKMGSILKMMSILRISDYGGTPPPFTLKPGETRNLTIEFKPVDSSYTYARFEIESEACYGKYFYASGGDPKKKAVNQRTRLTFPNRNEELIVGSDTTITWEGVSPSENVKLEYTKDKGKTWELITDKACGLSYKWRVPVIASSEDLKHSVTSNQILVRLSAKGYGMDDDSLMVTIPAGTFQRGNTGNFYPNNNAYSDKEEKPVHEVTISNPFLLGKYEVTQKLYKSIMGENPSKFKGDNLPVEQVSWYDAVEFCNKLSEQQGLEQCYSGTGKDISCNFELNGYRLPTEAEWEYACKAGTASDFYTGNLTEKANKSDKNLDKAGWYYDNSISKTHDVGQKKPNFFGLYDMSGNVKEWCWDWYENSYTITPQTDPKGSNTGTFRVLRGGSWLDYAYYYCRSSARYRFIPFYICDEWGFRICRTLPN